MVNKKITISPVIKQLRKGETASFPLQNMLSVKAICTTLSTVMGTVLKTSVNREKKIIVVTRVE